MDSVLNTCHHNDPVSKLTLFPISVVRLLVLFDCFYLKSMNSCFFGHCTGIDLSNNNIKYKVPKTVQIILDITAL